MIFGIDLGTTNSLISYLNDGVPTIIPNAHGSYLTPSVVSLDGTTVLLGQTAAERLATYPKNTVASFKRLMGSRQVSHLGAKEFLPEELSALILGALKADAEAHCGVEVRDVIISVPAYFNDQQRKATRLAGELAGLNVLRLVNEPTAAALFHGILERDAETKFLIFDLGGGTFDVSILERFFGVMEVRATGGDSFLGGDDFTLAMMELIGRKQTQGIALDQPHMAAAMRFAAETAKRALSRDHEYHFRLPQPLPPLDIHITQDEYEQQCAPLLERLRAPIERALRDARLRAADLDEIILVGGATRMPIVRKLVARLFGRLPLRHLDPDQTIALGAAVCAGLSGQEAAFQEVVLTDVCPHSLGTSVAEKRADGSYEEDLFLPIIERNTIIPASRSKTVCTLQDKQSKLSIEIFQGEARNCRNNINLGSVELSIPPRPAGEIEAEIRFTYDVNGILDVDIDVAAIGLSRNLLIKKLAGDVSEAEIAERRAELAKLKIHPRDQDENRALLERANRLYEQRLGDDREVINAVLGRFTTALDSQDPEKIREVGKMLKQVLDRLENDTLW